MSTSIACQLYTLREFLKTPADIAATLARVKRAGFGAVQLSALGPIDPKELAGILNGEGLTCCATHVGLERLRDQPQQVIDEHALWNCQYTALGHFKAASAAEWKKFAADFSAIAGKYASSPLRLGYHNHNHELVKFDGKTALQIMLDDCSNDVWMEIDTYWIQAGGGDPCDWIRRCAGRIPCVHFKDMAVTNDRQQLMAEVGEGNLNWPGILAACREAGVKWYIIEQDNCNGRDPFESIAISLRNLKGMGLT
ncbi:MAG TPA: sugar phosphate isomerase/epimerase [Tepidisphaeraceae bacterium]|nr:sugar phosphate isomerase/epimerase [Tepidisphaeraceae bacterium]